MRDLLGGVEIEGLKVSHTTLGTFEEIRKEIREDLRVQSIALVKIDELIEVLEGENQIAFHPDLPATKQIPDAPPFKPAKQESTTRTDPYKNVTTRSAILNLLGKNRGTPLAAPEVCGLLMEGGWGEDTKDPVASTRAALSGMRLELKVTKIENVLHYELHAVEDT